MTKKTRPTFDAQFKLETAQLVLDHGYTHNKAAKAMGGGYSTIGKWVKQFKEYRSDIPFKITAYCAN